MTAAPQAAAGAMSTPVLHDEKAARVMLGGIGRTKYFELLASGELESVRIGRRRFVPADALGAYVDRLRAPRTAPGSELDQAVEGRLLCPRCGCGEPVDLGAELACGHCGATWQADVAMPAEGGLG